jgi:hypothetical protein
MRPPSECEDGLMLGTGHDDAMPDARATAVAVY